MTMSFYFFSVFSVSSVVTSVTLKTYITLAGFNLKLHTLF